MNEPNEVEPLSTEAQAFLARHATTGEPSPEALARVQAQLTARAGAAASPAPLPLPQPRRRWLAPELLAVAAVLVALFGAQALWVAARPAPQVKNDVAPASGERKGSTPTGDEKKGPDGEIAQGQALMNRENVARDAGTLAGAEKVERVLETHRGAGGATPVVEGPVVEWRPPRAKETYLRAYQLKDSDPQQALKLFEMVLTLTAPGDEYHQKAQARAIELRARAEESTGEDTAAASLFERATQARREGKPAEALRLAHLVLDFEPLHVGANALVAELQAALARDTFLRGVQQMHDGDREAARASFELVVAQTRPENELHRKAKARLAELKAAPVPQPP